MRPIYENAQTLANEKQTADLLCKVWDCEAFKLPIAYRVDYAFGRESEIKAWVEIKCRNAKYEEMFLSLHKWISGKELSSMTGLPFVLVYNIKGELYWKRVENDKPKIVIGGRKDRNDWQDIETMAVFNIQDFEKISA